MPAVHTPVSVERGEGRGVAYVPHTHQNNDGLCELMRGSMQALCAGKVCQMDGFFYPRVALDRLRRLYTQTSH